ncbi:MAG: hypothetical protein AAGH79_18685 [Bacteroidota bacterium]
MKNTMLRLSVLSLFFSTLFVSCTSDQLEAIDLDGVTIWSGPTVTFTKAPGADPNLEENQDRITDEVWLSRGSSRQFYNVVTESSAKKQESPAGTLWAIGTTAEFDQLTFNKFRAAVNKPQLVVGVDLVMLLVEENIAIDVKITDWGNGASGAGFTYERSSE